MPDLQLQTKQDCCACRWLQCSPPSPRSAPSGGGAHADVPPGLSPSGLPPASHAPCNAPAWYIRMSTAWNAITIANLDAMCNTNMKQDPCYAEWCSFMCHVLNTETHWLDNTGTLLGSRGTGTIALHQIWIHECMGDQVLEGVVLSESNWAQRC